MFKRGIFALFMVLFAFNVYATDNSDLSDNRPNTLRCFVHYMIENGILLPTTLINKPSGRNELDGISQNKYLGGFSADLAAVLMYDERMPAPTMFSLIGENDKREIPVFDIVLNYAYYSSTNKLAEIAVTMGIKKMGDKVSYFAITQTVSAQKGTLFKISFTNPNKKSKIVAVECECDLK